MNLGSKKVIKLLLAMIVNAACVSCVFAVTKKTTKKSNPKASTSKTSAKKTPNTKASVQKVVAEPVSIINKEKEYEELLKKSSFFDTTIGAFPTIKNRIDAVAGLDLEMREKIVEQALATYPLLHQNVRLFLEQFLHYKKQNGTDQEKALYATMSVQQFLVRLLEQRPLMFMTGKDEYLLRSNNMHGYGGFEAIGTDAEHSPLIIKDYLSYDEMAVAALIGLSSPTYFINDGARNNRGIPGVDGSYEKEGVYIGLVGARFEKPGYMEWQHMIITPEQNTAENGYGLISDQEGLLSLWSNLYGTKFPTFDEARIDERSGRYVLLNNGSYLDKKVYMQRIRLVVEPFLLDAHQRARKQNMKAYVHVVGLGLGVWQIDARQAEYMLAAYAQVLRENDLSSISDIDFSWFGKAAQSIDGVKNGELYKDNNRHITIHFSQRNPADKLVGQDEGKLLVACYAWDGNAYPGNEYWAGMLAASGDPAAACCSTIAELQNPKINQHIKSNISKVMPVARVLQKDEPINKEPVSQKKAPVPQKKAAAPKKKTPAPKKKAPVKQTKKAPAKKKSTK